MNKLIAVLGGLSVAQATTLNPLPAGWGDLGCVVEEAVWYPRAWDPDYSAPIPGGRIRCPDNTDFTNINVQGTEGSIYEPWLLFNLQHAILKGAKFDSELDRGEFYLADLRHADLTGAQFGYLDMQIISFAFANLEGATFEKGCSSCDFNAANLLDATLDGTQDYTGIVIGAGTCLTQGCGADMCASDVSSALATQCPTCPVCPDTSGFIDPSDAGDLADAVRANPTAYQQAGLCM